MLHKRIILFDVGDKRQEMGEEDEPPPDSSNSFSDRVYRMVHGVKAYLSINSGGEDINLYSGIGRGVIGMGRSIEFPSGSLLRISTS